MSGFDQRGSASLWTVAAAMVAVVSASAIAQVTSAGAQRTRRSAAADLVALACVDGGPVAAAAIARQHDVRIVRLTRTGVSNWDPSAEGARSGVSADSTDSGGSAVSCVVEIADSAGVRQHTRAVR